MNTSENEFPDPSVLHPIRLPDGSSHEGTVFLKTAITHARIDVCDYTYASAHHPPADWAAHLAPYLYDFSPERLTIGRFCQIADGVQFITASANHRYNGISSFPFAVFSGGSREGRASMPPPGVDTVIGNDVWIGQGAKILPGARLGNGVIVGAGSVVAGDVPSYSIVSGNPASIRRYRFTPAQIAVLEQLTWWDWPIDEILKHEALICGDDVAALEGVAP